MKMAYTHYLQTKDFISIPAIAARNFDPTKILASDQFKALERIVTSEELPIMMFLTNIVKQLKNSPIFEKSQMIRDETNNLFKIESNQNYIHWLFGAHIQAMINEGTRIPNYKAILEYCLELNDAANTDAFFKREIIKQISFERNAVFKERSSMGIADLKAVLLNQGYQA